MEINEHKSESYIEKSLQNLQFSFKFTGLLLHSNKKKTHENRLYGILLFLNLLSTYFSLLGELFFTYDSFDKNKGFLKIILDVPISIFCNLGNFKAIVHFTHRNDINKLIEDLRSLDMTKKNKVDVNIKEKMDKQNMYEKETLSLAKIVKTLNLVIILVWISFSMTPIIEMALIYYKTEEIQLILPVFVLYPFIDPYNPKCFPLVVLKQSWAGGVCLKFFTSSDGLFYTCCAYIRIQFKLLQYDFEHLVSPPSNPEFRFRQDAALNSNFKDLVIRHQKLTQCAELLELVYAKTMLLNFVSSCFLICLSGFVVSVSDDPKITTSFTSFFFLTTVQIFLLCFFGDMVTHSSVDLTDGLYNCLWYHTDASFRRKMLIVLMRAQKPCKLTAYGFADVNLRAFSAIMSKSWSVFALLKTMYNPMEQKSNCFITNKNHNKLNNLLIEPQNRHT